ncbi:PKD domain-containing protein [Ilyomonas limi]|uniref:PKD domain-containing protein n=1 Tax=Ilyomonas limi TaxID=2575867 RepID=A0A4U3KSE0_9BACT|nr:PKD domain-containing protein [Ilyomonas limi]TKK64579.1 PKD domain-containing protein [Ilyomonas limi]
MKTTNLIILMVALMAAVNFSSCKKDVAKPEPFVFYKVSVDGATVTFTNESKGAASYEWDFGDGTTSTEESPTHTYPGKGKYVPTLYATSADGIKAEASTVLHIAKISAIKLDDNTLSDWDTVTHNVVVAGPKSGNFIKAKYDYDANYVYVYFEQNTTEAAGNIYDLYIDADNNITTGLLTGEIKNGAYEVLLEGTILGGWLDPYYFAGTDQAAFSYDYQSINEFYKVGAVQQDGAVQKFEFAISRSKIRGLTGSGLKIGVQVAANDWSAIIGYSPDQNSDAFYLNMSE